MVITLKLGEEINGLKLIQIDNDFIIVDCSKECDILFSTSNLHGVRLIEIKPNTFTEQQLIDSCLMYGKWLTGGVPSLKIALSKDEFFNFMIKSLKEPKVEIELNNNCEPINAKLC